VKQGSNLEITSTGSYFLQHVVTVERLVQDTDKPRPSELRVDATAWSVERNSHVTNQRWRNTENLIVIDEFGRPTGETDRKGTVVPTLS
jgi:hypothetical protein